MAVGADGAAAVAEVVGRLAVEVGLRGRHLDLGPGGATVGGVEDQHGDRRIGVLVRAVAAEVVRADVGVSEKGTRGGIVGPDLFLVLERGLTLGARNDDRWLPAALVENRARCGVV